MSACPSCIVYCDFGFCCGSASDDDLECHVPPPPPPPLPPPPPCHGHTDQVITVVNAPIQLPPPPHPQVIVPYNQLPPPLPAPPHLLPPAPTTTMVYDTPPPLQAIVPRRQCVPPPLPPAEVYDDGCSSPLSVRKSALQPKFGAPSRRHETDDDPAAPALSMVPTKAASTPAACDVAPPPVLQHPVEPSTDFELGMEYYSQQHHQEYFLMQGRS